MAKMLIAPMLNAPENNLITTITTATMSTGDLESYNNIFGTNLKHSGDNTNWASLISFQKRQICMELRIGSDYTKNLDATVQYITETSGSAYVFANSRMLTHKLYKNCENKLDAAEQEVDVLHVHGHLPAKTKFDTINVFCRNVEFTGFEPRVLVGTAATDIGVSCPNANHVTNMEWVDNVASWIQRMGRGSRNGEPACAVLVAGLGSYVNTQMRIYRNRHPANDDNAEDSLEAFSSLLLTSPDRDQSEREKANDLDDTRQSCLHAKRRSNFCDVLNLFCLNKGCVHRHIEGYQRTGSLEKQIPITDACGGACPTCDTRSKHNWFHFFMPLHKDGLLKWFDSVDGFPMPATIDNLMTQVWNQSHFMIAIFDKKSGVCKYNVEAMFLQLIAAGFLGAELVRGHLMWVFKNIDEDAAFLTKAYKIDAKWYGIHLADGKKKDKTHLIKLP